MHVWDAVLHVHLHTFRGHKDTITVSGTRGAGVVEAKCSIWHVCTVLIAHMEGGGIFQCAGGHEQSETIQL